jgi:hypothetical protein
LPIFCTPHSFSIISLAGIPNQQLTSHRPRRKSVPQPNPRFPIPRSALEVLPPSPSPIPLTTLNPPLPCLVKERDLSPGAKYPLGLHPGTCHQAEDRALARQPERLQASFPPPQNRQRQKPQGPQEASESKCGDSHEAIPRVGRICNASVRLFVPSEHCSMICKYPASSIPQCDGKSRFRSRCRRQWALSGK